MFLYTFPQTDEQFPSYSMTNETENSLIELQAFSLYLVAFYASGGGDHETKKKLNELITLIK